MYGYESRKLSFQLVPRTAWCSNLRSMLLNWSDISACVRSEGVCSICGAKTYELDAHEVWNYDDSSGIQTLARIDAVCKDCHRSIHIGHASVEGEEVEAFEHYIHVNNISEETAGLDMDEAFAVWRKRSKQEWHIDVMQIQQVLMNQIGASGVIDEFFQDRYYAFVPYKAKDTAKSLGARWDPELKKWYFKSAEDRKKWNAILEKGGS